MSSVEEIRKLTDQRDRFAAFAALATDILIEIDLKGTILSASGAAKRMLGVAERNLAGTSIIAFTCDFDRPVIKELIERVLRTGNAKEVDISMVKSDGNGTQVLVNAARNAFSSDRIYLTCRELSPALDASSAFRTDMSVTVDQFTYTVSRIARAYFRETDYPILILGERVRAAGSPNPVSHISRSSSVDGCIRAWKMSFTPHVSDLDGRCAFIAASHQDALQAERRIKEVCEQASGQSIPYSHPVTMECLRVPLNQDEREADRRNLLDRFFLEGFAGLAQPDDNNRVYGS